MKVDWEKVLDRLAQYPPETHRFLPPCSEQRMVEVTAELGEIPEQIKDMLHKFNGAELFIRNGPMITLFGISPVPPLAEVEWAQDWWIDKFTPAWRAAFHREKDWAIAISNYDGLTVLDDESRVREWDRGAHRWGPTDPDLGAWIERILKEGEEYMSARTG
jgi:hypothetical protein